MQDTAYSYRQVRMPVLLYTGGKKKEWNTIKPKNILRTSDIFFIIGTGLLLAAHFMTNLAFWIMSNYQDQAQNYAMAFEANPLAISLLSSFSGIALMISYIFQPAIMLTAYYIIRKKWVHASPTIILFIGVFIFFLGLTNSLNDLANLIGLMINRGII